MSNSPTAHPRAQGRSWSWLPRLLPDTRWSLLGRIRSFREKPAKPGRDSADEFCRAYWHPLYAYLRSCGHSAHDSQDHVQSFMERLLREDWLDRADPAKGQLRHFLLRLLTRHVSARRAKAQALKRGGGSVHVPFDSAAETAYLRDTRGAASPEDCFRLALAVRLVDEGVKGLRAYYAKSGQEALCEALLPALEGPLPDATFDETAAGFGMRPATLRMAALRMRERFRLHVRMKASLLLHLPLGPELDRELRDIFTGSGAVRP